MEEDSEQSNRQALIGLSVYSLLSHNIPVFDVTERTKRQLLLEFSVNLRDVPRIAVHIEKNKYRNK